MDFFIEEMNLLTNNLVKPVKGRYDVEIVLVLFMFCCLILRALLLLAHHYCKMSRKAKTTNIYTVTRREGQKISMLVVGFLPDGYGMLLGGASLEPSDNGVTKVCGITNLGCTYVKKMEVIFPLFFAKYEKLVSKKCILLRPSAHLLKDSPKCKLLMLTGDEDISDNALLPSNAGEPSSPALMLTWREKENKPLLPSNAGECLPLSPLLMLTGPEKSSKPLLPSNAGEQLPSSPTLMLTGPEKENKPLLPSNAGEQLPPSPLLMLTWPEKGNKPLLPLNAGEQLLSSPSLMLTWPEKDKKPLLPSNAGEQLPSSPTLMLTWPEKENKPLLPSNTDERQLPSIPPVLLTWPKKNSKPLVPTNDDEHQPEFLVPPINQHLLPIQQNDKDNQFLSNDNDDPPPKQQPLHKRLGCDACPALPPIWLTCLASCILYKLLKGRMSDKRIEMYWKELCSQENSSKTRNKALLDDFDRIEQQSAALEAQTEKLKQLKDRYECYINSMYPRWLDELKRHKQRLQLDRDKTNLQESQPHEELRSNNVRFGSPLYTEQNQETFMASSLYDSQDTTQHAHDTYNQTSIPHGTGRVKTLDWDSYHRESSLDFYNFGQISSMRTPHGHFAPRNDYMRFSTPYNPAHNGPFDSRNGLNQSFDMMYGNTRNYHPRHPFMGSPIRHNGPASPGNGHGRSYYNEETHLRPDNSDISYQQPYTSADYYSQSRHQQHRPQQNHPHDRSRDRRPLQGDPPQDWRPYDNQSRDGRPQQGDPPQDWRPHDSQSRDGRPQLGDPPQDWRPYDSQSRDGRPQLGDPPQDWRSYDSQSRDGRPQQGDHSQDWYPLDRQSRDGYPQQKGPPHDCHPQDRQSRGGRQQQAEYGYTDDRHFQDQHEDTYKEPHKLNVSDPQKTEVRSPASAQHSPNEPPEKPLELAIDLNSKHEKPVENKIQDKEIPKEKASIHSSNTEKPEKLEQEEISASTESGLLLSDLQPRVSQQTAKQEMNLQDIDQKSTNSEKRDQPKNKKEDNKKSPKGSGRIKPDSDDLLDILSDGTLSSGDVSDSDLSHNYDNAYEPSLEIAMDGLTKNSNVIQIKQDSALLNKPNPDIIINEQSSKHINTQITENPSSNKQDGNKKSNIEDVGGDVLTPSPSNEEVSPSVSVKGSLSLLQVVDADVEASSSPETFYRAPRCSQEMKEDIIERAESGSSLENYDPSNLSMVLLDELPKITRASPSGGLVTSDNMGLAITEPQQLR
ncbi:Translation initiation factor IF-2 [Exaiptasia diaphana]|nr:Translation initiation factor IF-2 [Exaiptasia diaphana]